MHQKRRSFTVPFEQGREAAADTVDVEGGDAHGFSILLIVML